VRKIAVIGSTGSVGRQALEVIAAHRGEFRVTALTGHANLPLLVEQAKRFSPSVVGISCEALYKEAKAQLQGIAVVSGADAHAAALEAEGTDTSLIAVVGFAGLKPLVHSIESGLHTCVANKESIVCGGGEINKLLSNMNARIFPVDSEHSAIFQCLDNHSGDEVRRILLTCSGGAFRDLPREAIEKASAAQALVHPNWSMGAKITIDSATLANKGLEVMEAHWLFGVPYQNIEVVVHRQSIIHSMVEWEDGSVIAQLGYPDMRLPIQVALGYPRRLPLIGEPMDFTKIGPLTFEKPDTGRFPCLKLAYEAGRRAKAAPIAFNAANEMAVQAFMDGVIGFYDIPLWIEDAMDAFMDLSQPDLAQIPEVDREVRRYLADRAHRKGLSV
jgi:1-deoxy-D-xylulose-5-phosphate reductoisomerase